MLAEWFAAWLEMNEHLTCCKTKFPVALQLGNKMSGWFFICMLIGMLIGDEKSNTLPSFSLLIATIFNIHLGYHQEVEMWGHFCCEKQDITPNQDILKEAEDFVSILKYVDQQSLMLAHCSARRKTLKQTFCTIVLYLEISYNFLIDSKWSTNHSCCSLIQCLAQSF